MPFHPLSTTARSRAYKAFELASVAIRSAAGIALLLTTFGCGPKNLKTAVVLYCAQDQVFAEPILADFSRATGVPVKTLFDSEAVKTVGLANRLIAERDRPMCDVYWGNEELRTRQLLARGVLRSDAWASFGHRTRTLVARSAADLPGSFTELTNSRWRGRFSIAYPLFGSTCTHFLVLRHHWGASTWKVWCQALAANRPFLEEGNSQVIRRLQRSEVKAGFTDSDDVRAARREGADLVMALDGTETFRLPNTVALVSGRSDRPEVRRLYDYLQSPEVRRSLITVGALDPESEGTRSVGLDPNWSEILASLDLAIAELQEIFQR
ncbi:MAG: hypothetical protein EXS36_14385 [Pedosphaera sp.]|nr:hypothetical protein [Pedosphaera sp.]